MPHTARILLAEDDPVGRAFLLEALRGLGVDATAVGDGEAALDAARREHFDLLILDHHLPGLNGDRVLTVLRADAQAVSQRSITIATTADPDPSIHDMLRAAGFARVLVKPLNATTLHNALHEIGILDTKPPLDNDAGLAASGSVDALRALRELFARDLATLGDELDALRRDPAAFGDRLHRLRAACGFCGAVALGDSTAALADAVRSSDQARIAGRLDAFRLCLNATRAALQSQD